MKQKLSIALAIAFVAAAVPVFAHHSFAAEFDAKKPVKLQGTVTQKLFVGSTGTNAPGDDQRKE